LNLIEIIKDAISRGYVPSNATLASIQYGVEACNTNSVDTTFEVNDFSVISQ
jgi:hypothetical protein